MKYHIISVMSLLFFCVIVAPPVTESAITTKLKAEISYDNGEPVENANLVLAFTRGGQGRTFTTNKKGKIFSPFIDVGTYNVTVEHEGYYLSQFTIKIKNRNAEIEMDESRNLGPEDVFPPVRFQADRTIFLTLILSKKMETSDSMSDDMQAIETIKKLENTVQEVKELYQLEKYEQALKILDSKLEDFPEEAALYYLKGIILFKQENNQEALTNFTKSLGYNPEIPNTNFYLAEIFAKVGQKEKAIEHYEAELAKSPDNEAILIKDALLFKETGQIEKAIEKFLKVIEIDPDEERAKLELAELYQKNGQNDKAQAILKELEQEGVKDAKSYFNLGVGYWNEENFNLALDAFKKATIYEPELALAHKQVGFCYVKLNEPKQAIEPLEKYLKFAPDAEDKSQIQDLIRKLKDSVK